MVGGSLFIKSGAVWRGVMPTIGRETGEMVPGEGEEEEEEEED